MPVECICQNPACGKIFRRPPSQIAKGNVQFCSQACRYNMKSRADRFWEKVLMCEHGEMCPYCHWLWQEARNPAGYGMFVDKLDGHKSRIPAQRVAWELVNNRSFPRPLWGLHHCDVRACCNPWHIYPGTPRENQRDVIARDRRRILAQSRITPLMYEPVLTSEPEKIAILPTMAVCQNDACGKTFRVAPYRITRGWAKYCSRDCMDQGRTVFGAAARDIATRLWENVDICNHGLECETCCWEWRGKVLGDGSGRISVKTNTGWRAMLPHRLAWELVHEKGIPAKHFAFHTCKNRKCCNTKHLIIGKKENGRGVPIRRPLDERLWEKVRVCSHGPMCLYCCWIWEGTRNANGYGVMHVVRDGKAWSNYLTHRLAWELVNNQVMPPSLGALHHCDTPPCCNPWHLYPGTQSDNIRDAYQRNRRSRTAPPTQRGEEAYNAKLKDGDIPVIFELRTQGWTHKEIADYLHADRKTIAAVLHRHTWTHVPLDAGVISAGQVNGLIKLKAEDIPLIFQWHAEGETRTNIAQRLHVSRTAVGRVLAGKTWKTSTEPYIVKNSLASQVLNCSRPEQLLLPLASCFP